MRPRPAVCAAAALALAIGCVPVRKVLGGRDLEPDDARRVTRGTTKAQLLEWFGPPVVIARAGRGADGEPEGAASGPVALPTPAPPGSMEAEVRRGDAWFEPFAVRQPIRETHRVYHWSCAVRSGMRGLMSASHQSTRELWVLVDEETGLAEGAVFRER